MSVSDENNSGYTAIGEAVMGRIFDEEEISRESLMLRLTQVAERELNHGRLLSLSQGRRILDSISEVDIPHGNNVVNIDALRLAEGSITHHHLPAENDADAGDNDSDEMGQG